MAASALGSLPISLPVPRTHLIGRTDEVGAACGFLLEDAVPLLTLTGPGGVGKTRLALAVGHDMAGGFTDGATFVDLAPLVDPDLVPATVASVLGVVQTADRSPTDALLASLHREQRLLLLDNCEHVLDATADLVARLLAACPAVQILATSRAPLRIRGEQLLPVEPLPLPPAEATATIDILRQNAAIALFVERTCAVRPSFALTETSAEPVATICRRLDGVPLAIELAAARMRTFSLEALLAQMTDRLQLLQGGARDLPARQQTLAATIAWSYDLLSDEDRRLFRQSAVFAGGWTVDAAAAIGALPPDQALLRMERLVDQSLARLLERAGEPRFTMLETVREYGLERLAESGAAEITRRRHADYFVAFAESVAAPLYDHVDPEPALLQLDAEQDNLRAALVWATEHGEDALLVRLVVALKAYWYDRVLFEEGRAWVDRAVVVAGSLGSEKSLQAAAHLAAGWYARVQGDNDRAEVLGNTALAQFQELDDAVNASEALELLGFAAEDRRDYCLGQARHTEMLARVASLNKPARFAKALRNLGWTTYLAGDVVEGERWMWEAVAEGRRLGYRQIVAAALSDLAKVVLERGEHARATELMQERLDLTWDAWGLRHAIAQLAEIAAARGESARAARLFGAVEANHERFGAGQVQSLQALYAPYVAMARNALGEAAFAAAWAKGRSLSLLEARAEAALVGQPVAMPPSPLTPHVSEYELPPGFDLTRREREVLTLLCQRLTDSEIAEALFLSPRTASKHVGNILGKLGVNSRREVAALAARRGLV